jgi:WbqC-like protein family
VTSEKKVAIVQSCYIPWKGYFDLINRVDEFVLYDDRQFTRRDWRNRNRIKTPSGPKWLTIPVQVKGRYLQRIDETLTFDTDWTRSHFETLRHSYSAAPFFDLYEPMLRELYAIEDRHLSRVNRMFIEAFCGELGIDTMITWSTDYEAVGSRTERLVSLCLATGATRYLSGPNARSYLELDRFEELSIAVEFVDYDGYPEYTQLYPPFDHAVSIIDLLVHTGPGARYFMKSFMQAANGVR